MVVRELIYMDEYMNVFKSDMGEHLDTINECLLEIEKDLDTEMIGTFVNKLFRSFHTMKSMTESRGYHKTSALIHRTEDLLFEIREGRLSIDTKIIELVFLFHDFLENALEVFVKTGSEDGLNTHSLSDTIYAVVNKSIKQSNQTFKQSISPNIYVSQDKLDIISESARKGVNFFIVIFKLKEQCLLKDIRIWMNFNALSEFSRIVLTIPQVEEEDLKKNGLEHLQEDVQVALILSELDKFDLCNKITEGTSEVELFFVDELCENKPVCKFNLGDLEEVINEQIKSMEKRHNKSRMVDQNPVVYEANQEKNMKTPLKDGNLIKVSAEKLEGLVDLLGELMILHSQHREEIMDIATGKEKIINNLFRIEKVTQKIQDVSMSLKMQPLKNIFQRLRRVARDTSQELDKQVEVEITGENTEIDRDIGERIFEPLMHLVRNAIAHGIENKSKRNELGKNHSGTIYMNAFNKVGYLYIQIRDDGQGLNKEIILEKAIEKGLANKEKDYKEDEIFKFIFLPGFSTQKEIDNISGRGVGLNVVEEEVTKLRGRIDIESISGNGCCFTVKIPIQNAIMTGTVIQLFNEKYVLPTLHVKEIIIPTPEQWISVGGEKKFIQLRDEIISLIDLYKSLGIRLENNPFQRNIIVILEMNKRMLALPVEKVLGKQEVVVKPLEEEFKKLKYTEGVTILGNGKVSLILDVGYLFQNQFG
jgi:two-component system chemotaxis sensor kinase CheA